MFAAFAFSRQLGFPAPEALRKHTSTNPGKIGTQTAGHVCRSGRRHVSETQATNPTPGSVEFSTS